jgi:hypothetical protein
LTQELKENVPTVILTHFSPVFDSCASKYDSSPVKHGFMNNLESFIENNNHIVLWSFGHTHCEYYKKINNCMVISNPLGYGNECSFYDSSFVIKVNY